jgi:hypothetical protein
MSEGLLEELGDLVSTTFGPRPRLCLVVQRRRHHVIRFRRLVAAFVVVTHAKTVT